MVPGEPIKSVRSRSPLHHRADSIDMTMTLGCSTRATPPDHQRDIGDGYDERRDPHDGRIVDIGTVKALIQNVCSSNSTKTGGGRLAWTVGDSHVGHGWDAQGLR